ncbi:MAG: hypothetical protein COU65_03960 [Candidatus Pacebacteria bacterium CG10_big_fil_rev_8_21_14_0_10_42_12]|nr:hypothetical protein [Candidatus Paceibacterota bacterium]PIR62327.1 MAG: hypothetical protein COU65_03960 [Candidatus Pacebacteria bacterium CG10_big_fil_rev_8_21_14_0_10_42_12]
MKTLQRLAKWYTQTWWESISDIGFYKRLQKTSTLQSLGFAVLFYVVIAIGYTTWFQINIRPNVESSILQASEELISQIPDDETFSWDGSRLDFSQPTNITVKTPAALKTIVGIPQNALSISSDEETKESLVSISPTQVNVSFRDQEQVSNLNEMFTETFSATGQEIKSGISSGISTLLNILSTLVAFLPLMIFAGFLLSRGMFLVVEIIMVWLVLKLYQRISNIGYVVRLSLHLLIIAEIPHQLGNMLGLVLPFSLLSLSFWVLLAFVVLQLEKQPTKR